MGAGIVVFACGIDRKIAALVRPENSASAAMSKQIKGALIHIWEIDKDGNAEERGLGCGQRKASPANWIATKLPNFCR
jgi:hypothetical protein